MNKGRMTSRLRIQIVGLLMLLGSALSALSSGGYKSLMA
jgi:hypothetical protein